MCNPMEPFISDGRTTPNHHAVFVQIVKILSHGVKNAAYFYLIKHKSL